MARIEDVDFHLRHVVRGQRSSSSKFEREVIFSPNH